MTPPYRDKSVDVIAILSCPTRPKAASWLAVTWCLIAALALVAGCGGVSSADLDGRTFASVRVEGGAALVPGTRLRLTFEDGGVHADAGCNAFGGEYDIRDGKITADGGITQMLCSTDGDVQDFRFARLLSRSATISLGSDQKLRLSGQGTTVTLEEIAFRPVGG